MQISARSLRAETRDIFTPSSSHHPGKDLLCVWGEMISGSLPELQREMGGSSYGGGRGVSLMGKGGLTSTDRWLLCGAPVRNRGEYELLSHIRRRSWAVV